MEPLVFLFQLVFIRMRKPLLALAACGLLLPAAQAQTERGSKLLGVSVGNLSFQSGGYQGAVFSAALHPTVAYFLANNLALGAKLNFGYGRQRYGASSTYRQINYGLSPFVRYYALGSGRHRAFVEAGGDFGWTSYRNKVNNPYYPEPETNRTVSTSGYHAALGYSFFLVPTAALEASAGYYRVTNDPIYSKGHVVDVRVGFSIYLPAGGSK